MRVCTFGIFIEQGAILRFLTLKGLRASAIATELKSVYETEGLTLSTVKRWRKDFAERRTSLYDNPRCGKPLANELTISSMLKKKPYLSCKVLCQHFRIAKGTCVRVLHNWLGMKSSVFIGLSMPSTRVRRPKGSLYHMEFFRITERSFCWCPECHHWR
jgi:hypothetical protein